MGFSVVTAVFILLAGVGAGFVGYAVGASSLVSYPALLGLGIPPVIANASNTVGVLGTGVGSALGARVELRRQVWRTVVYLGVGALGGVVGSLLLLSFDPKVFEFAVPPLILFSSLIIAVNPRGRMEVRQAVQDVTAQARAASQEPGKGRAEANPAGAAEMTAEGAGALRGRERSGHDGRTRQEHLSRIGRLETSFARKLGKPKDHDPWWVWLGVWFVAIYSGYFGAGAGTCALAVLDASKMAPFHEVNALKTIIGAGANVTATLIFIARGVVDWPAAILLCVGSFIGGYVAPPITRRIPARIMRIAAVVAGVVLAANLAWRTYL